MNQHIKELPTIHHFDGILKKDFKIQNKIAFTIKSQYEDFNGFTSWHHLIWNLQENKNLTKDSIIHVFKIEGGNVCYTLSDTLLSGYEYLEKYSSK